MSRRGNCHDNAVAESFFQLLKRERIKKKIYGTREEARSDIFDYIEMFYNSKRRHGSSDQMSPVIRVKQPALARFSPDVSPLFVHFRADDDVTARLYARGYRLRPEFFK
nr:hypothetical protein JCDNAKDM_00187 [Escherichia coli]